MTHHSTMCIPGTVPAIAGSFIGELAEYLVLERHDLERNSRYGDMSRARRAGELNRLADALISDGYKFGRLPDGRYGFVDSVDVRRVDLEAAFERVLAPRERRLEREPGYLARTPHSVAAKDAYRATARWVARHPPYGGLTDERGVAMWRCCLSTIGCVCGRRER